MVLSLLSRQLDYVEMCEDRLLRYVIKIGYCEDVECGIDTNQWNVVLKVVADVN